MGDASWDPTTRATVQKIPLLTVKAGPRDKEEWQQRLKEVGAGAAPERGSKRLAPGRQGAEGG